MRLPYRPYVSGNQTRAFKAKTDAFVVVHMQETAVSQRKASEGALPSFFADPTDPDEMFDSLDIT